MDIQPFFTEEEKKQFFSKYKQLLHHLYSFLKKEDLSKMKELMKRVVALDCYGRDKNGINGLLRNIDTALIATTEIGLKRTSVIALLLYRPVMKKIITLDEVKTTFDADVTLIISRLLKTSDLYARNTAVDSENFHKLLFSFAEDVRVILIMIADRLCLMRLGKQLKNDEDRKRLATEVSYLYAPLAHRLGLYTIKSELEDLSLKYTDRKQYDFIKQKLNETKRSRDAYIAEFITPIKSKLEEAGLQFDIKGRTKSIHSINNKLKKQNIPFEDIYDLFAIRIILDSPVDKEKQECWQVYSIVTDMYMPNPKRLRDWLSVPKSNGYESLHTTVMGPEGKWVEVQIRTERMDEIAERGLAAHWRYKGVKGESGLDEWLTSIRETLENADSDLEVMDQFKLELYEDEVFVFTPKGDLYKMPKGATVLDFAFAIHSKLGSKCIGAKVNGKNAQLKQTLNSGDQVEVMTSNTQTPKRDWLNIVTTSKARTKIRQAIKEIEARQTEFAKETIERKFKNRKLEYDEAVMMRLIKKLGYKTVTEFYQDIANETRDANDIIEKYLELKKKETENREDIVYRSAENFSMQTAQDDKTFKEDVLVIDQNLKGLDFKLAKCCNPIYGDDVFGFVTISGGIKIHRTDCPNARELQSRFAYRIVKARWAGKSHGKQYPITLRIVGHDDIGIVTNITSIINKENDILLRSISIDSHDGLFSGMMTVMVDDTSKLESLVKKIKTVKGVKQVNRG